MQSSILRKNKVAAFDGGIKRRKVRRALFITLMLAVPLLQFTVFTLYTNVRTFVMAFRSPTGGSGFALAENLKTFAIEWSTSNKWKRAIWNSLGYFPVSTLISLPLSIITAYFLYKKVPLAGAYKIIFFIPSVISIVVMGLVFRYVFASNGPVNTVLRAFGVQNLPIWFNDSKVTMPLLYVYSIWAGIGYNCILLFGALSRVPKEVSESSALDGCGTFREIFSIYIPIMWPTISTMILFGVTTVFTMFLHTQVLADNGMGDSWTMVSIIMEVVKSNRNPNYAATLSIMLIAVGVPITQLAKWLLGKVYEAVEV